MEVTAEEGLEIAREYVDPRHLASHRMLGEETKEHPTFDEIIVTDLNILGDSKREIKARRAELKGGGGTVRAVLGTGAGRRASR